MREQTAQCTACKAIDIPDTMIKTGETYYLCTKCASTCFDCGTEYDTSILTEDNEPWCDDCITLFNYNRDAWRERWNAKHDNNKEN